jgi:excinuclease ABC subunit B
MKKNNLKISINSKTNRSDFIKSLVAIHFERTNADLKPGTFRGIGNIVEVMPVQETCIYQFTIEGSGVKQILKIDPISRTILKKDIKDIFIFPAKHFLIGDKEKERALVNIKKELDLQIKKFEKEGKLLEADRIKRRTSYDIALIREVGYCSGIENYGRHLSFKKEGEPPETLLSYFPRDKNGNPDFLTIIDESHVTLPQLRGMYAGDASRKKTLVEFGFRLPSAKDNRPLRYEEFESRIKNVVYVSATPSEEERRESLQVVEQIIRPTGLLDPEVYIRPILEKGNFKGQIFDFINEANKTISKGGRVLATTLTKKMAEDLVFFLKEDKKFNIKAEYLHSDIKTIDRIKILTSFRKGLFDCIIGVNLLREGLDLPEVELIGILDADKEGFLRSETSLIQTIGRAARNEKGKVILYADRLTNSIEKAVSETNRRRDIQIKYNIKHNITPTTIKKNIKDITEEMESSHSKKVLLNFSIDSQVFKENPKKLILLKEKEMSEAVSQLDFETAAILRDEIILLKSKLSNKL